MPKTLAELQDYLAWFDENYDLVPADYRHLQGLMYAVADLKIQEDYRDAA